MYNDSFKKPIVILLYYFEIYLHFICTGEVFCLHVCMSVHHLCAVLRSEEDIGSLGTISRNGF